MDVRIVLRILDREAQSGGNFVGDGVAPVGVVDGDQGDTFVDLKQDAIHLNPPLSVRAMRSARTMWLLRKVRRRRMAPGP